MGSSLRPFGLGGVAGSSDLAHLSHGHAWLGGGSLAELEKRNPTGSHRLRRSKYEAQQISWYIRSRPDLLCWNHYYQNTSILETPSVYYCWFIVIWIIWGLKRHPTNATLNKSQENSIYSMSRYFVSRIPWCLTPLFSSKELFVLRVMEFQEAGSWFLRLWKAPGAAPSPNCDPSGRLSFRKDWHQLWELSLFFPRNPLVLSYKQLGPATSTARWSVERCSGEVLLRKVWMSWLRTCRLAAAVMPMDRNSPWNRGWYGSDSPTSEWTSIRQY